MSASDGYEFGPRPWALATFFVVSVFVIAILTSLLGLSALVVIVVPAAGTWFFNKSARVSIDRAGVIVRSTSCRWSDIELRSSQWGSSLRSASGVARSSRLNVFLPMYLSDWESHPLAGDLRRWAPHFEISR